jgi:3-hydroxyacyl-[acyl-carrier-protein] dehydratase
MSDAKLSRSLRLNIPPEHPCYADHFPGAPLVPGALLLKWIMAQLEDELRAADPHASEKPGRIHYLKQIKFLAPVLPGAELLLNLSIGTQPQLVSLSAYVGDTLALKGQLEYVHD